MKYVVAKIGGRQYKLEEGDVFETDKSTSKINPEVLLFVDGEKVTIGKPEVKGVRLDLKVVDELVKGKKILVSKYKAKSRYRKRIGFRPQYTRLSLIKIG